MTDAQGRAPPERERRPGQEAAILGKSGDGDQRQYCHNAVALSPTIGAPQHPPMPPIGPRDWGELREWGERVGIPVRPSLWGLSYYRRAPAWIVVQLGSADLPDWLLAAGCRFASHVIIAPDIDRFCHVAAALAADGGRVLLIERPIVFPGRG